METKTITNNETTIKSISKSEKIRNEILTDIVATRSSAVYDSDNNTVTIATNPAGTNDKEKSLVTYNADNFGIEDNTRIADLSEYINAGTIKNKTLLQAFKGIQTQKGLIRIALMNIGKELNKISLMHAWKDDAKALGMKTKSFEEFCKVVLGSNKTTVTRYINVYKMCSDAKGNVDKKVALLTNAQLFALLASKAEYSDICAILDQIEPETNADDIAKAVNAQKLIAMKKASEKTKDDTDDSTDDNAETKITYNRYKGTLKGQTALKIPNKYNSLSTIVQYVQTLSLPIENALIDVHIGGVVNYIIIHDADMRNVLTYYYKHGEYKTDDSTAK